MSAKQKEINRDVVEMSSAVPAAILMQVNSHSTGLMYEQSVVSQQRDSLTGLSSSVIGIKKMGSLQLKKNLKIFRKSRFDY